MAAKRPLTLVLGRIKELLAADTLDIPNDADFRVAAAETRTVRIGNGRTGNGTVDLLFISDTSYPSYGLRIRRTATLSSFTHRGTGSLYFNAVEGYVTFATASTDRMVINNAGQISLINGAGFANGTAIIGAAGEARRWGVKTGTSVRWEWGADGAAESGSNAGSNYVLRAYDDAGASLGDVLTVTRATRVAAFNVSPTVPTATAGDNSTKAASTAYVDAAVATVGGAGGEVQKQQVFTGNGTFTPSAALLAAGGWVEVLCVGGGGGGGANNGTSQGCGGSGGCVVRRTVQVAGAVTVTVGAGGAGFAPAGSGGSGSTGSATTFGALVSAAGGIGGSSSYVAQNNMVTLSAGEGSGTGGVASGSSLRIAATPGAYGFGRGGEASGVNGNAVDAPANTGNGGNGAMGSGGIGGDGGSGICIVTWWE